ncbi:hypothetical protein ACHAWX_004781 [Stephanocyclus meneghinianus]
MNLSTASSLLLLATSYTEAFTTTFHKSTTSCVLRKRPVVTRFHIDTLAKPSRTSSPRFSSAAAAAADASATPSINEPTKILTKQQKRIQQIKSEGGPLAFNTKYGALNPFAIYYGLTAIGLGLVWFMALTIMQLVYKVTGDRIDKRRRIPVFLSHVWGTLLMAFTGCFPKIENGEIIRNFHKSGRKAMFVSNHNSWMDIPFIGHTIGWHNYKFVAKKELEKVPILGKAIMVSKNVCVDRSDRKSQLMTLKQGMKWLDDGVNLCTFPEGTRSRTNRLMPFMGGAFKMAQKAGAPVVPISIVGASKVMPSHWMFPYRPARNICKVIVHEPVESVDKTEEELNEEVRGKIIEGLPEEQRPLQ